MTCFALSMSRRLTGPRLEIPPWGLLSFISSSQGVIFCPAPAVNFMYDFSISSSQDAAFADTYRTLRSLADAYMRRFPNVATLQATALVHEAYLKLNGESKTFAGSDHFIRTAAMAMRQILVDHARARQCQKRGGDVERITLDGNEIAARGGVDVLLINDALQRLRQWDPRQAQIVELRCFMGLSVAETAQNLQISEATVKRDWSMARAWLEHELSAR